MKENILKYLEKNKYISGEILAEKLGISRVAIWKQIKKLKDLHYGIISHQNLGYCLISRPDLLLPDEIQKGLDTDYMGHKIYYYRELESSNITAREKARSKKDEISEGTVIITEKQTGGKGRLGRKWFSPEGGIWLSIILYPHLSPAYIPRITLITAVAVVKAIKELTRIQGLIKWPNDILIHEKKVCGILTEMSAELDLINWLVIGLGINANIDHEEFPEEIKDTSISLKEILNQKISRVKLVQLFLREFEKCYNMLNRKESAIILNEWKLYSHTLGKKIKVKVGDRVVIGQATDINDKGALVIKKDNGECLEIISGTILK
jgi:BirA family biotin operon repressor/biotin-[acetyl-CoA-carboxylase] ligase